jgi:hypothetical protein
MSSDKQVQKLQSKITTSGGLRRFLANVATGVVSGDIKPHEAAVAVKAAEVIVASHYSEAKIRALATAAKEKTVAHGQLLIGDDEAE